MKRFCWNHDWAKWGGVIKDYSATRYQYRACKKCNKIIRRRAFWNNSITDEQIMESIKEAGFTADEIVEMNKEGML